MPDSPPALRLLPAPGTRLPDRPAADPGCVQGSLALEYRLPSGLPAVPQCSLMLIDGEAGAPGGRTALPAEDDLFGPQPTSDQDLPDPKRWAARLSQAVVEVLSGHRPAHQLSRWMSHEIYSALRYRTAAGPDPGKRRAAPPPRTVRSVHVGRPADGIAEATAVITSRHRAQAMAMRLEGIDGRWRCTALAIL